jgi:hypothetical protein
MAARPSILLVLVGALASLGAQHRTQNFVVEAPTAAIAQQVGQYAEYYRRDKALQWLGQEMPPWPEPCPLRVTVSMNGSGGATSFAFDRGRILGQDMHIEGSLDRLLASVLPHEVTHTVFAHYFRSPVPRWADEGGSVLSEDDQERSRHDGLVRQILNTPGRAIPLRRLFSLTKYPNDVMVLYAEGYSVTNFLVGQSSRQAFLAFVAQGMRGDWDGAARAHYHFANVEELEQAWLQHLRNPRQAPAQLASNRGGASEGDPSQRVVVRQTAPPAQPLLEAPRPLVRGQAPGEPEEADPRAPLTPRHGYLPDYPAARAPGQILPPPPGGVKLGAPQSDLAPPQLGAPVPLSAPTTSSPRQ